MLHTRYIIIIIIVVVTTTTTGCGICKEQIFFIHFSEPEIPPLKLVNLTLCLTTPWKCIPHVIKHYNMKTYGGVKV
jgi:hypothetical protein